MYGLSLLLLNHGFKFQDSVCNGCYNLTLLFLIKAMLLLALLKIIIIVLFFYGISKSEAIHLSKRFMLNDRGYI